MKHPKGLFIAAILCVLIPALKAQTGDWGDVEKLAPGTSISVVKRHGGINCTLARVTDSELDCIWQHDYVNRRYVFVRNQLRELRLDKPEHTHMIAGAIIGAAAGGLAGLVVATRSNDPETRVAAPAIFALGIGSLAAGIGYCIHQHGPVIYRRR
ncbi:MAG TPA: hypothetical protein VFA65_09685 [Bryobacteraceae bacterium]|nr:hypothetical protein [Bryobacteraceae bacterium]